MKEMQKNLQQIKIYGKEEAENKVLKEMIS